MTILDRYNQAVLEHQAQSHKVEAGFWYSWCRDCAWYAQLWIEEGNPWWIRWSPDMGGSGLGGRFGYKIVDTEGVWHGVDCAVRPFPDWLVALARHARRPKTKARSTDQDQANPGY